MSSPTDRLSREATFFRLMGVVGVFVAIALAYLLRGVLVPLFVAFLLAYALDPAVDKLESWRIPRAAGACTVMLGIVVGFLLIIFYVTPLFVDELRVAAAQFPDEVDSLRSRVEPWLYSTLHIKLPHTISDISKALGDKGPQLASATAAAVFGTLGYVSAFLSLLIIPVFALYLLIDFDRIVQRVSDLVPRRWTHPVAEVAHQIHKTLGGYVRGQLTANFVLAALYAAGLRFVDIRLAVPIGFVTGMLAFVPYVGFSFGLTLALSMAILDWHGVGTLFGVLGVMGFVQLLDGMLITPRIVGRSVGLAPLEVLVTMMAAGTLFGFLGVVLAVPLGAVVKILVHRSVRAYLKSEFYLQRASSKGAFRGG